MSNSLARNEHPGTVGMGPTRQQLDELDALLQRMLDLPVSQVDEPDEHEPVTPTRSSTGPAGIPVSNGEPPPVRYYEPDVDSEEDESPPPGYPPTETIIGAAADMGHDNQVLSPPYSPRLMPVNHDEEESFEAPVPGGRHDLEDDEPVDPTEELARIRAMMQENASLPPTAHIPNPPKVEPGDWVPLRSSWQPSAQTWKPLAERWEQSAPAPSASPPMPTRNAPSGPIIATQTTIDPDDIPEPPPLIRPQPAPPPEPVAAPEPAPPPVRKTPWALWPLVWFNAGFDVLLLPWCPKGKWLRGSVGRHFLGVLGVLCLMAAGVVAAAEWFGWIW